MFWSTLILAIPALALAGAVWGVLRRKWYGVLPLLAVAMVGWSWKENWWLAGTEFLDACSNQSPVSEVMMLLLAGGTSVMALAALWSGWSRSWWFWRALVFAVVPASLVPLEANELILLCLMAMPVLTGAAWFLRNRSDQMDSQRRGEKCSKTRGQFSLANLFLAFIVLGLLATALRSVLVGHIIMADWGLLWLAASVVSAALTAASPVLARGSGRKWLIFWSAAVAIGAASWWWLGWNSDPLGLAIYFRRGPSVAIPLNVIEGELCFVVLVGFFSCAYGLIKRLPTQRNTATKVMVARVVLLLLALVAVAPLGLIYPSLIPPRTTVVALPKSQEYDSVRRAAFRLYDLGLLGATTNPSLPKSVTRKPFLTVLNELDEELARPGHVTYDVAELIRERVSPSKVDDPKDSLTSEFRSEIQRAIHDKRDADAVRLARLQWRVGQTFYRGGTMEDYFFGFGRNEYSANQAIIAEAPSLSDQECRELLKEAQAMEAPDLGYETVKEFDDYWTNATSGWRDRLYESAFWLSGEKKREYWHWSPSTFQEMRRRPLGSLRIVQYVVALELYRREHGQFPASLPAVQVAYDLPEIIDPFSKVAPVYRRTDAGFLLYSVGLDGKDDGGKFPPPSATTSDFANQDINLVPDREALADQWQSYLDATAPTVPFLPVPAPPKAAPGEQE
jgi:hypothetical protein